jgi:hypothetical protein
MMKPGFFKLFLSGTHDFLHTKTREQEIFRKKEKKMVRPQGLEPWTQ